MVDQKRAYRMIDVDAAISLAISGRMWEVAPLKLGSADMQMRPMQIRTLRAQDFSEAEIDAGQIDWPRLKDRVGSAIVDLDVRLSRKFRSTMQIDMLDLRGVNVTWHNSLGISMVREARHLAGSEPDVTVTIPLSGEFIAEQHGRAVTVSPGQAVLLDASRASRIDIPEKAAFIGLRLSHTLWTERFRAWREPGAMQAGPFLLPPQAPSFSLLVAYFLGLRAIQSPLSSVEALVVRSHLLELVDGCVTWGRSLEPKAHSPAVLRDKALALMQRHHEDATLTVADVAEWLSAAPADIEACFQEAKTSFDAELMLVRVIHIGSALKKAGSCLMSVPEIALMHGMDELREFYGAFERFYGVDPQTYRSMKTS